MYYQGDRIHSKGMWYVEPCGFISDGKWIELQKSQIKYDVKQNANDGNDDIDVHLRKF